MVLRKSFYIRWSAGRSPRVHEVNPGRDPSTWYQSEVLKMLLRFENFYFYMIVFMFSFKIS